MTRAEALILARMRRQNAAEGGGAVTLHLSTRTGRWSGTGWLDWRSQVIYLAIRDTDHPGRVVLMLAGPDGVATRRAHPPATRPPLPAPRRGWRFTPWSARTGSARSATLRLLLAEALAVAGNGTNDCGRLWATAIRLRTGVVDRMPVTGFEVRRPGGRRSTPDPSRLRFWLDGHGVLRRLDVRTRDGAARLDVAPGPSTALRWILET